MTAGANIGPGWTPERVAILRKAVADGKSASEAGKLLRITRSAAIGKAYRLGITFGLGKDATPADRAKRSGQFRFGQDWLPKPKPPKPPKQGLAFGRGHVAEVKPPRDPVPPTPEEIANVIPLMQLGPFMCRWPIGDPRSDRFGFCGKGTAKTYCTHHARIAFQPMTAEQRRSVSRLAKRYA